VNSVEVPIADKKNPPVLKFPNRCVNCGKSKETGMPIKLNMGVEKRGQGVLMDLPVPLCRECEKKEQRITQVTLVPFVTIGLIVFVFVFIPVMLVTPAGTTTQTLDAPFIMGALAGLIAGLIGGTLAEVVTKLVFVPVYGRLLLKRPLMIVSLFNESEDVVGLSARFGKDRKSLNLIFENENFAQDFKRLNSL
jgi:hypothetical protein